MSSVQADDLTHSVSKLVELNQQIKEARSDIKVLAQAEKALKLHIKKLMVDNGLDVINTRTGKITVKKSIRKVGTLIKFRLKTVSAYSLKATITRRSLC